MTFLERLFFFLKTLLFEIDEPTPSLWSWPISRKFRSSGRTRFIADFISCLISSKLSSNRSHHLHMSSSQTPSSLLSISKSSCTNSPLLSLINLLGLFTMSYPPAKLRKAEKERLTSKISCLQTNAQETPSCWR